MDRSPPLASRAGRSIRLARRAALRHGRLQMPIGTIKSINERGFGFLAAEDGVEYFFHRSSVEGGAFESLTRGSQVEFEIEPSTRGPRAGRVRAA